MAILTKSQLTTANSSSFPDNNSQLITPQVLRDFNQSVIDTLVDSLDTGSFANTGITNAFTQQNNFTSISASSFVSASNFVGDGSKLTNVTASVALPILDEGVLQGYATSMNFTGSAISASVVAGTAIVNVNIEGAGLVTTQSFNPFTQSVNQFTQSASSSISQLNASSASQQVSINALNVYTASQSTASIVNSISSLNQFTQSAGIRLTNLETTTASLNTSVSNLNSATASINTSITNLNSTTASINSSITQLNASSASQQVSINAINQATQSLQNRTGSYATTGSNTFSGNQIISGTFQVTDGNDCRMGIGVTSNDIFLTAGGASNIAMTFGGDLQLNGDTVGLRNSVGNAQIVIYNGTGAAQKAYTTQVTATGPSGSWLLKDAQYNKTYITVGGSDENVYVEAPLRVNAPFTASLQQGYVWVGNSSGVSSLVATSSLVTNVDTSSLVTTSSFNAYTQSNNQRVSSLEAATSSLFTSASLGLTTASVSGVNLTFTKGDGTQFTIQTATGSVASASYAETASLATSALDIVVNAKNTTGAQLNKGTVVRIIGATGDNPLIQTASWENDSVSANTLGFVVTDIANDAFGRVMTQGTLLSVNTDPALGYTAGQLIYLSSSGQYTNVQPPAPYHEVRLGQVLRAQQNNGSIYVLVQNGYELSELHDVNLNTSSLANNNLLAYNSASSQWENKTLTEVGAATTGSNIFNGNQTITGSLTISSSATYDIDIIGGFRATAASQISSSTGAGVTALNPTFIAVASSSVQALVGRGYLSITNGGNNISLNAGPVLFGNQSSAPAGGAIGVLNNSSSYYWPIQFQSTASYTDGRVTISTPLSASAGFTASLQNGYAWVGNSLGQNTQVATSSFGTAINTGSFATTGSNTFTGQQTISEGNGLAVVGGGGITLAQNLQNSGSQYASVTIFADPATFGPDLYEGFQVLDNSGNGIVQMAANTYTPQFGGELVAWIGAGGNNAAGNNTAMIFRTGSADMLVYKPTSFAYDVNITGSLTASLQQGYVWVGASNGKTTTVATSSFVLPSQTGSFATTGSNNFNGNQVISGSLTLSSSAAIELNVIGNTRMTGSLTLTGSAYGNVVSMSITSNTASMDLSQGNYFELTSSTTPCRINLTNLSAGLTATLIVSASASSSILFSTNVAQPSGSAYSGSAGSIDILSFVAFNSSKANVVATKALI